MKIDKFNKLKLKLEVFRLEQNYMTLDKVLYYFSFLGNIFLIYFGYFFVKSITNTIPTLFPFQEVFFTGFIALFLTGYELTKRFTLEQFFIGVLQVKRVTTSLFVGGLICSLLIAGSFYLSIKGAHRLVDNSESITTVVDANIAQKQDSIAKYYDTEILYFRNQSARTKSDKKERATNLLSSPLSSIDDKSIQFQKSISRSIQKQHINVDANIFEMNPYEMGHNQDE